MNLIFLDHICCAPGPPLLGGATLFLLLFSATLSSCFCWSTAAAKMSIDKRLGALTESVELLASLHKDNEKRMQRVDKRERKARKALLSGQ